MTAGATSTAACTLDHPFGVPMPSRLTFLSRWSPVAPTVEARARQVLQLAMAGILAVITVALLLLSGPGGIPTIVILLDLVGVVAIAVPWSRLPSDAFAAVGLLGLLAAAFGVAPEDPLRNRAILFSALIGAGGVSRTAGLVVGITGAAVALSALGRTEPIPLIVTSSGSVFLGFAVPTLLSAARPRHFGRRSERSAELSDYAATLAHEVSAPIASIGAGAQMLVKQLEGHPAEATARAVADEAKAAYALLESLADLSAIEAGRLRLSLRRIDIAGLVRGGFALVQPEDRRIVLDVPSVPIVTVADDRRIRQVLRNLVGNAAKYSAPGTKIEVRVGVTSDRRSAIVQVRDEGPAIPPRERQRVFDKFVRLSTAGATRGSGLGLHISRAIVIDHGGEIWAEWPATGGNMFSFTLPLARAAL